MTSLLENCRVMISAIRFWISLLDQEVVLSLLVGSGQGWRILEVSNSKVLKDIRLVEGMLTSEVDG